MTVFDKPDRGGDVDEDLVPIERVTALEELKAELAEPPADTTITLAVPARPKYSVRFNWSLAADFDVVEAWWKKGRRGSKQGVDIAKVMAIVAAATCETIVRDGVDVEAGGDPVTFATTAFQELLATNDRPIAGAVDCVRVFYGSDGHVIAAGQAILSAAGYGEEMFEEGGDPTPG